MLRNDKGNNREIQMECSHPVSYEPDDAPVVMTEVGGECIC